MRVCLSSFWGGEVLEASASEYEDFVEELVDQVISLAHPRSSPGLNASALNQNHNDISPIREEIILCIG